VVDGKIPKWQTVEIGIRIPEEQRIFRSFLADRTKGKNPYAQTSLRLQFICHGKFYYANAFYYEDAVADEKQNKYVTHESEWPWRIRFAVPDTGHWTCNILVGDPIMMAVPKSSGISFECVPGNNHGYITIASDHRHFQYSDGTPFFALGQDIGWSDGPVLHGQNNAAGYFDFYHYINNLADNGGNYVRIVMIPWSTGIQWDEMGVYAQDHACALDSVLQIAETRGMKIHLCLDLTTGFANGDAKENQNPIRRNFQKDGMTAADLLRDSSAVKAMDQFIKYVYARWAFSPSVATIELIGEENRWEGFDQHENYFSDFYSHENDLLRNQLGDHDHLLSTSSTNPDHIEIYENPAIGFIDMHHYDNNFNCNKKRFQIVNSRGVKKLDKPFLFGELGMINGPVNAADAGDYENCNDVSMHNALWATAFMGAAGAGIYWWNWSNDNYRAANFPALRFFIDSVAGNDYCTDFREWDGNGLETFYETRKEPATKRCYAIGWVHNESAWWGNMDADCKERNNKQMIHPKDDDKSTVVENRAGNRFVVKGLLPNWTYNVTFYDTRIPGKKIDSQKVKSNRRGTLALEFPANCNDCAFKISLPTKKFGFDAL